MGVSSTQDIVIRQNAHAVIVYDVSGVCMRDAVYAIKYTYTCSFVVLCHSCDYIISHYWL